MVATAEKPAVSHTTLDQSRRGRYCPCECPHHIPSLPWAKWPIGDKGKDFELLLLVGFWAWLPVPTIISPAQLGSLIQPCTQSWPEDPPYLNPVGPSMASFSPLRPQEKLSIDLAYYQWFFSWDFSQGAKQLPTIYLLGLLIFNLGWSCPRLYSAFWGQIGTARVSGSAEGSSPLGVT